MRARLSDLSQSRLPQVLGECAGNLPAIASYVNEATQRLLYQFAETGFWGAWAKVVFNVPRATPYLTLPSIFARAVNIAECRSPVRLSNEWYEFLEDGIGLQSRCANACNVPGVYDRGMFSTAYDLTATNQLLRIYYTDERDIGKRVLVSGALDQNGNGIYSQDGTSKVNGFWLTLENPFTTTAYIVTGFTAIAKDVTYGDVLLKQVDADTGAEVLLARYTPQETNPQYRRYLVSSGMCGCCCSNPNDSTQIQVTAMCKYEYRPVSQPSDFLLCANIPALKLACESIRHSEMDNPAAQQMSLLKWSQATKALNDELQHQLGDAPAITVSVGYARGLRADLVGSVW